MNLEGLGYNDPTNNLRYLSASALIVTKCRFFNFTIV